MKILPSGDLEVAPAEKITVTVTKSKPPYAARKADLIGATWATETKPNDVTDVETFPAPAEPRSRVTCGIIFDFVPSGDGTFDPDDQYTIEIRGNPAEETRIATVVPPPIVNLEFTFIVRG
jgi:hypothetical protein